MNVLEKAQRAIALPKEHGCEPKNASAKMKIADHGFMPCEPGFFTFGDFCALVEEFTELRHRMDGLEK